MIKYFLLFCFLLIGSAWADEIDYSQTLRSQYGDLFKENLPYPKVNPKLAKIGEKIFFDKQFSKNGKMSCSTCHIPEKAFSDENALAIGNKGQKLPRRTMSLYNVGNDTMFFWDGRGKTLEEQFFMALSNPEEMAMTKTEFLTKIRQNPNYVNEFRKAGVPLKLDTLAKSVADYVRTIKSPQTKFDKWLKGNNKALTLEELKGFELFNDKADCTACHFGAEFTDNIRNDIGLPDKDLGFGAITKKSEDAHYFKTTGLRGIAHHAPYMHNGVFKTLEEVINHYNDGTFKRGDTDIPPEAEQEDEIAFHNFTQPLNLTEEEKKNLIAFLKVL